MATCNSDSCTNNSESPSALCALNEDARLSDGNSKTISLRGYVFARTGRTEGAHSTIEMLQTVAHERYVPPYATAQIHLGMGQSDQAFDWHNRAFAMRDVHLAFLPNDVKWDPLRSDPRFGTLLERCGFVAR